MGGLAIQAMSAGFSDISNFIDARNAAEVGDIAEYERILHKDRTSRKIGVKKKTPNSNKK